MWQYFDFDPLLRCEEMKLNCCDLIIIILFNYFIDSFDFQQLLILSFYFTTSIIVAIADSISLFLLSSLVGLISHHYLLAPVIIVFGLFQSSTIIVSIIFISILLLIHFHYSCSCSHSILLVNSHLYLHCHLKASIIGYQQLSILFYIDCCTTLAEKQSLYWVIC